MNYDVSVSSCTYYISLSLYHYKITFVKHKLDHLLVPRYLLMQLKRVWYLRFINVAPANKIKVIVLYVIDLLETLLARFPVNGIQYLSFKFNINVAKFHFILSENVFLEVQILWSNNYVSYHINHCGKYYYYLSN